MRSDEIFPYYRNRAQKVFTATGCSGKAEILSAATAMSALCQKRTCLIAVVVFAKRYRWTFGKTRAELQELCLSLTGG